MRNARLLVSALLSCVVLISASCAFAQDWPQWRGPNRDAKVAGFVVPAAWPATLTQQWKTAVGAGDSTPALVDGKLYVFARQGDDEVTSCLNAADGKIVWQDKNPTAAVGGPAARHPGPRSSPAVADGKVVTLGVNGTVSCLDAATGKVLWRKDVFPNVVPKFYTSMSPLIANGMAIAHVGGDGNGALVAFDLATGDEKWRCANEAPQYASPVLMTVAGTEQIVTLSEKSVIGVGLADGKLLWEIPFVPQGMAYNSATPIIDGQTVIFTGAARGTKAVNIAKQGDAFTATEAWSNPDIACQFSTPVLENGFLYGLSNRGNLFCIDAKTGKTAWLDTTQRDRSGFGAVVDLGAAIVVLPSNGTLIGFQASDKAYTELGQTKVADTPTYAFPVFAGKNVFVKDQDSVILWTLP